MPNLKVDNSSFGFYSKSDMATCSFVSYAANLPVLFPFNGLLPVFTIGKPISILQEETVLFAGFQSIF